MRPWTIDRDDDGQPIRLLWTGSVRLKAQKEQKDDQARGDKGVGGRSTGSTASQLWLFSTFGENEQ